MSVHDWHASVERYLEQRRALGYALASEGRQLRSFACFLAEHAAVGRLTVELALEWASRSPSGSPIAQARRLRVARGFARFVAIEHPDTEIPPRRLLGRTHRRLPPTIFTETEIRALLQAAAELPPQGGLRPLSMRALLGLLAASGLRPGEAVRLERDDVDDSQGVIYVRAGKSGRARDVWLHPTATEALRRYAEARDERVSALDSEAFFLRGTGKPLGIRHADYGFRCLCRALGWRRRTGGHQWPRLYDLRHTFVCHRLLAWYAAGEPVEAKIPYLATYLGHRKISSTYWYLTGIPELMDLSARRFEAFTTNAGAPS